jgi:hypothetical protein
MIKNMEDVYKRYNNNDAYQLEWSALQHKLNDINGNCSVMQKPVTVKLVNRYNAVQFSNSKVYMTDNKKSGKDRAISLVVILDDNIDN